MGDFTAAKIGNDVQMCEYANVLMLYRWPIFWHDDSDALDMKNIRSILGGLAGAAVLNALHESIRRFDHFAPRVELVGGEALTKLTKAAGAKPLTGNARYGATLAGDLISNGLYYALIGIGSRKHLVARGAAYGLAAGVGALTLTKPLGLRDAPVNRTARTQVMTVGYYLLGGLAAALAIKALKK